MSNAHEYRRRVDEMLRLAARTQDLNERSRLISQAVHLNELAIEAERLAAERRRADATVVPFGPRNSQQA